mmetsp:Transcript_10278/g.14529  ORF Transcript_10278/g.14529 Transcript_10278/m.14529 type:complete len:235 (-) Transcript_10278:388-1092(-)
MIRSFAFLIVGLLIQFKGTIAAARIPRPSLSVSSQHKKATEPLGYEILDEKVAYNRWRSIVQRSIRLPNGNLADFDIVGQKADAGASIVFAWNTKTKTCTLVKEYNPGCHKILTGLAAGLVEDDKHGDCFATAAEHELEEECHLSGENSQWYLLTTQPIAMDKYASTLIAPYLVLDPEHVENPKPLDDEEDIEILRDVPVEEVMRMIREGEMNVIGSWASLLAIEKLRELGEIS